MCGYLLTVLKTTIGTSVEFSHLVTGTDHETLMIWSELGLSWREVGGGAFTSCTFSHTTCSSWEMKSVKFKPKSQRAVTEADLVILSDTVWTWNMEFVSHNCCYYGYKRFTAVTCVVFRCCPVKTGKRIRFIFYTTFSLKANQLRYYLKNICWGRR